MKRLLPLVVTTAVMALAASASGQDALIERLITEDEELKAKETRVLSLISSEPGKVKVKISEKSKEPPKEERTFDVSSIRKLEFVGEPEALTSARNALLKFDAAGALADLAKIKSGDLNDVDPRVRAEAEFVRAVAQARIATGAPQVAAAERALRDFLEQQPNSHHTYTVREALGDLLARAGRIEDAEAAYAALDAGPAALRIRGASLRAELSFRRKQFAEAKRAFLKAAAIGSREDDQFSARQKLIAEIRAARCMVRLGEADEAAAAVTALLRRSEVTDREVLGLAYLVLGDAQRTAGKDQDALLAFLTIDLVHNQLPDLHAEALFNLVELWDQAKNPERARAARRTLETKYPDSPWTRNLPPADAS